MTTIHFSGTDRKVFTPISGTTTTLLGGLSNGNGTIVVLVKQTTANRQDFCAVTDSGGTTYYHGLMNSLLSASDKLGDDIGGSSVEAGTTWPQDTTNWYLVAADWTASATENFHWRNQTTLGSWTNSLSSGSIGAAFTGPGSTGWLRLGYAGDNSLGSKDQAVVAIWNVRFSNSDYGTWTKTSDLWNHALGHPIFLCELNASTPVDLAAGSTYSSGSSSGTTFTGADPDNWTFDGVGTATAPGVRSTFNPVPFMPSGPLHA